MAVRQIRRRWCAGGKSSSTFSRFGSSEVYFASRPFDPSNTSIYYICTLLAVSVSFYN